MAKLIHSKTRLLALFCLFLAMFFGTLPARAEVDHSDMIEEQVKAAFLYKFGSYVEWPAGEFSTASSPLTIGVIGAEVLADQLVQMTAGRTINGHPIIVRKLQDENPGIDVNVLFVGHSHNSHLGAILAAVKGRPVLTVTESDEGMVPGSMINFVIVDGKVRFEIAPEMANRENLLISARLLAAAYRVSLRAS